LAARGGAWDRGDNGLYTISQVAGQVTDMAGNPAAAGAVGQFTVRIPKTVAVQRAMAPALAANTFSNSLVRSLDDAVWA
jgi:hypothetical protein